MAHSLFTEDIVSRKDGDASILGLVERTSAEIDTHTPSPESSETAQIRAGDGVTKVMLKKFRVDGVPPKGTVFVRWPNRAADLDSGEVELIFEHALILSHRQLFIGDVVTRGTGHALSGTVLNVTTRCSLQPMIACTLDGHSRPILSFPPRGRLDDILIDDGSGPGTLHDIPVSELRYAETPGEDDLVVYKGWIGRVQGTQYALTLQLSNNSAVEISEEVVDVMNTDLADEPPRVGDLVKSKKGQLRTGVWKFGQYSPNIPPIGTVVSARPTSIEVEWLVAAESAYVGSDGNSSTSQPPTMLERDEFESDSFRVYDRCRRPGVSQYDSTVSNSEIETDIGLRVRFENIAGAETKYDGSTPHGKFNRIPRTSTLGYEMNVLEVTRISADVTVQWQDLSITTERAVDLAADNSIDDEHAAWPGEIAHALTMWVDPSDKTLGSATKVGVIQRVKPEERMATIRWCSEADVQYSTLEADTVDPAAGTRQLVRRVIGSADGEVEEISLYDVEAPAELNVRRGDIVLVGSETDADPTLALRNMEWLGEIVDTRLDGQLTVRLGCADVVRDVVVRRESVVVAVRSDRTDEIDPDGGSMSYDSESSGEDSDEMSDKELEAVYVDENGDPMDIDDVEDEEWESADEIELNNEMAATVSKKVDVKTIAEGLGEEEAHIPIIPMSISSGGHQPSDTTAQPPEPYAILDTAIPEDHHFLSQPSTSSSTHTKRTQKEHKILRSADALPTGVYVRSWESRLDLFRVLFVGPDETPYASCPFIMDFYLPTDYPLAPPQAHFHCWAGENGLGGTGKPNPNLYEDGKICLSLLGTWEGDKGEGWSPSKSTLLQVFVSLLGLVLVREPYFNEAGYEPLAGLESSRRPSALYNERTFLRANGFVISAVSAYLSGAKLPGLDGLKDVVAWLYLQPDGPRLLRTIATRVETVLERSERSDGNGDDAQVLSKGATIPLRRIADKLRALLASDT